jgi:hypothetical protein
MRRDRVCCADVCVHEIEVAGYVTRYRPARPGKLRGSTVLRRAVLLTAVMSAAAFAKARQVDDYHWEEVERVVAIGDLHGDYQQYLEVLRSAGLISERGRWSGEDTHLVQTGDIPDRGPGTVDIIEHLQDLKRQARRKGGRVHTLIGNHETMNSYGDLRYVHPGEFEAFVGSRSEEYRERQWQFTLKRLQEVRPEEFLTLNIEQYRSEWEKEYPLGWVEHRIAWLPTGPYGKWILGNPVAIKVNDTIFLHGGLSAKYCSFSLRELTEKVHREVEHHEPRVMGILEDPEGPLWYRGLALEDEEKLAPLVERILERYGAARIVVGHTPTGGIVWPRFDGRVIVNDTGISSHYGGYDAYLELGGESGAVAGYGEHRLAMPARSADREAYLREVLSRDPENSHLQNRLERMLAPPEEAPPPELPEEVPLEHVETILSSDTCQ